MIILIFMVLIDLSGVTVIFVKKYGYVCGICRDDVHILSTARTHRHHTHDALKIQYIYYINFQ